MPVIAIARCRKPTDYELAVRSAGGTPWIVDQSASASDVVRAAAGILLAGGGDVAPALYGEQPHPTFDPSGPGRDLYEIELVTRAREADIPIMAICRGVQLLNVALGGTLVQDIPSELDDAIEHRFAAPPNPASLLAHTIAVQADSRLGQVLGARARGGRLDVNSRHHQAIKKLGDGLLVTATAVDGVIEAVEDPNRRFLVGVQWHPENFWRTGEFAPLFEAFIAASL
jgi:putative glutamine amidotransferase